MDWELLASIGIILAGLLLFFILANRRSYRRHKAIDHYTAARDQLSDVDTEEDDDEDESEEGSTTFSLASVITTLIAGIIVISVGIPIINNVKDTACGGNNFNISSEICTGSTSAILDILPTIMILGIVGAMITGILKIFK